MTPLTVSLPDALTEYIQEQLAKGAYNTADDYIQALIQQDKTRKEHLEPLILEGLASGDATPMTTTDWDNIRAAVHLRILDSGERGDRYNAPHQSKI
ncbi:MAG: type II toxin-antitoxin system ParD family antitoxin [Cyanothece sp. SIO2G6]|nr:type II toxin-antitoxin system ParD family antitoxin [Cyanothece sp. SIO2G6]